MKWKMFLRTKGSYSLAHLCNDSNETVCGWKYEEEEYTKIRESEDKPFGSCNQCEKGIRAKGAVRTSNVR